MTTIVRVVSTVANRYELLDQLGSGGMATVWRAWDQRLQRPVAVKLLSPLLAADAGFQARFEREARHAASLSHPNVVTIFDFGADDGVPYLVMELVDGESLAARLRRVGRLDAVSTVEICSSVLDGLSEAHDHGIIHRDIKPSNILIGANGNVKVADFGVARTVGDATQLTDTGMLMGTVGYLSPEQCAGKSALPRSDLYAVGCVAHECLTGRPLFTGESAASVMYQHQYAAPPSIGLLRPETPPQLVAAVDRALQKDPHHRFTTAHEMSTALSHAIGGPFDATGVGHPFMPLDHLPTQDIAGTRPLVMGAPAPRAPKRTRWKAVLIGAAALLLVSGAAVAVVVVRHRGAGSTPQALSKGKTARSTSPPSTTTTIGSTTTTSPPPVQVGFDYGTAVQQIENLGYDVYGDESEETNQPGPLYVITATCTGSADGYCQNAFFFVGNKYIGTDTANPDMGVSVVWQTADTAALSYPLYEPGDPSCCPTGGDRTVRFYWNGSHLTPLDPLPDNPNEAS